MSSNTWLQRPLTKKKKQNTIFTCFKFICTRYCTSPWIFTCYSRKKPNSPAPAVSSPYPLSLPAAGIAPLCCRQVLMVSRRILALHCRLHSCIISCLSSTVIRSQLEESWELGISYLFSKSLSWLWRDAKKDVKIKRKRFILFFPWCCWDCQWILPEQQLASFCRSVLMEQVSSGSSE